MNKFVIAAALAVTAAASQAVTWTILTPPAGALGANASAHTFTGSSIVPIPNFPGTANGNRSVTLLSPNASVQQGQSGTLFWEYQVSGLNPGASAVNYSISGAVFGAGSVIWSERVFGIDSLNNEIFINQASGVLNSSNTPGNSFGLNGTITLTNTTFTTLRVKKTFILTSGTGSEPGLNGASVSRINQNIEVVPEPATMTALALGAAALLRRRKK